MSEYYYEQEYFDYVFLDTENQLVASENKNGLTKTFEYNKLLNNNIGEYGVVTIVDKNNQTQIVAPPLVLDYSRQLAKEVVDLYEKDSNKENIKYIEPSIYHNVDLFKISYKNQPTKITDSAGTTIESVSIFDNNDKIGEVKTEDANIKQTIFKNSEQDGIIFYGEYKGKNVVGLSHIGDHKYLHTDQLDILDHSDKYAVAEVRKPVIVRDRSAIATPVVLRNKKTGNIAIGYSDRVFELKNSKDVKNISKVNISNLNRGGIEFELHDDKAGIFEIDAFNFSDENRRPHDDDTKTKYIEFLIDEDQVEKYKRQDIIADEELYPQEVNTNKQVVHPLAVQKLLYTKNIENKIELNKKNTRC